MDDEELTPTQRHEAEIRRAQKYIQEQRRRSREIAERRRRRRRVGLILALSLFLGIVCGTPLLSVEGPGVGGKTIKHTYSPEFKGHTWLRQYGEILIAQFNPKNAEAKPVNPVLRFILGPVRYSFLYMLFFWIIRPQVRRLLERALGKVF